MRCFGDSDLSHDSFLCGRDFGRRNDEWSVGSVKSDHVIFGRVGSIEEFVELAKVFDFSAIDFLDDHSGEVTHVGGEAVVFYPGEDDNVFHVLEETFGNVVGVDLA